MNKTGDKCESCLMPFYKDKGKRTSDKYCSLCFKKGKLCYAGKDLKEFQRLCYDNMIESGMNPIKANFFTFCIRFAPRWKKKK